MFFRVSMLAVAMFSGAAMADGSLDQVLTQKEGMTLKQDGLYVQANEQGESYVAVNQAGRQALLTIVKQNREVFATGFAADGTITGTEQSALNDFDRNIAELSQPTTKAQDEETGYCGTTMVYAKATSNGGTTATAYAVASNATGPVAATTNFASTVIGINYQSANTIGATPASLSTSNPRVCGATGFSTVTCPGESNAKVNAFAVSYRPGLGCWFQ